MILITNFPRFKFLLLIALLNDLTMIQEAEPQAFQVIFNYWGAFFFYKKNKNKNCTFCATIADGLVVLVTRSVFRLSACRRSRKHGRLAKFTRTLLLHHVAYSFTTNYYSIDGESISWWRKFTNLVIINHPLKQVELQNLQVPLSPSQTNRFESIHRKIKDRLQRAFNRSRRVQPR